MRRQLVPFMIIAGLFAALVLPGTGVLADHTNPRNKLARTDPAMTATGAHVEGAGTWQHIKNFPPNPGTDLEFIYNRGRVYASTGTLGQANSEHVGQRLIQLLDQNGNLDVKWVADHGSSNCPTQNPQGTTGLQHDVQIAYVPGTKPRLMTDTTDATGRCHDPAGAGFEIVDVTGIQKDEFKPREIALLRFAGFSHTHTVDQLRPWIIYNSSSDFAGRPWIEVVNVKTCLRRRGLSLEEQRAKCRPKVYRIPFQPEWTRQRNSSNGQLHPGSEAACHDITSEGFRIYCAGLNASLIFDVENLVKGKVPKRYIKGKRGGGGKKALAKPGKKKRNRGKGKVRGQAIDCKIVAGTRTAAPVYDCASAVPATGTDPQQGPLAEGWQFLGTFNHPGRDCQPGPGITTNCNFNSEVPSTEGVSVSHEVDPTWDGNYMAVTDERGGGIVPGGATCEPGLPNPYGNGGIHFFDIRDPSNIQYAQKDGGGKAVWIGEANVSAPTFCTVHVIEKIPDENRFVVAYYSQGTKIVDYSVDAEGEIHFRETASIVFPGAETWAAEDFKIVDNGDGTRTYYFISTDIGRGIDVFSWTGPTHPIGAPLPKEGGAVSTRAVNAGLVGVAILGIPLAARFGRRRRRRIDV